MTTNRKKNLWMLGAAVSVLLAGCGKKTSGIPTSLSPCEQAYRDVSHTLVRSDLVHLCSTEHEGYQSYDQESSGLFSQVFGGASFADVRNYLDTRLRYYLDPEDRTTSVTLDEKIASLTPNVDQNRKGRVSASNIGTALWYKSQILEKPLYLHFRGRTIPIESTRIGIMMMGEAYESTLKTSSGETKPLPPEYRQSILIHEARHSDCTGGLSKKILQEIREEEESGFGFTNTYRPTFNPFAQAAKSTDGSPVNPTDEPSMDPTDFPAADPAPKPTSKLSGLSCGHLHANCPPGHLLEGIAACDSEPWGAYTIGAVFYRGVIRDPSISSLNYNLAAAMIADVESRILVPRTGSPDMTSKGLVE